MKISYFCLFVVVACLLLVRAQQVDEQFSRRFDQINEQCERVEDASLRQMVENTKRAILSFLTAFESLSKGDSVALNEVVAKEPALQDKGFPMIVFTTFVRDIKFSEKYRIGTTEDGESFTLKDYIDNGMKLPFELERPESRERLYQILQEDVTSPEEFLQKALEAIKIWNKIAEVVQQKFNVELPKFEFIDQEFVVIYKGQQYSDGDVDDVDLQTGNSVSLRKRGFTISSIFHVIGQGIMGALRLGYAIISVIFGSVMFILYFLSANLLALLVCGPIVVAGAIGYGVTACTCDAIGCCTGCLTCNASDRAMWTLREAFTAPFKCITKAGCSGFKHAWKKPLEFYGNLLKRNFGFVFFRKHLEQHRHFRLKKHRHHASIEVVHGEKPQVVQRTNAFVKPQTMNSPVYGIEYENELKRGGFGNRV